VDEGLAEDSNDVEWLPNAQPPPPIACYHSLMRLPPRARLAVALTLALLSGACSSRPIGPLAPIPLDGYVAALIDHNCARSVACRQMPDMATCLATTSADLSEFVDDVSAGKIIYDGAAAATCFAATSPTSVACTMTAMWYAPEDPSCGRIFIGTQAEGAACVTTDECASANCDTNDLTACTGMPTCCAGTCGPAAAAPLSIGSDCSAAGSRCVAGAFCSASRGLCVANVAVGQPCDPATEKFCGIGLTCGSAASGSQQVCLAHPAEGESCATLATCDALDDYCEGATRKCVPKVAVGGACPDGVACVDYAQCDGPTRTCVSNGKAGALCTLAGPFCLGSLECTKNGLCELPAPAPASACP